MFQVIFIFLFTNLHFDLSNQKEAPINVIFKLTAPVVLNSDSNQNHLAFNNTALPPNESESLGVQALGFFLKAPLMISKCGRFVNH